MNRETTKRELCRRAAEERRVGDIFAEKGFGTWTAPRDGSRTNTAGFDVAEASDAATLFRASKRASAEEEEDEPLYGSSGAASQRIHSQWSLLPAAMKDARSARNVASEKRSVEWANKFWE